MKCCLLLETSLAGFAAGLVDYKTGDLLWQQVDPTPYSAQRHLDGALLERLPEGALEELRGIALDHGPGSFTGIRLGCSWSLGLSLTLPEQPVWHGFSGVQLLAAELARERKKDLAVVLPNTRTHAYVARGWVDGGSEVALLAKTQLQTQPADGLVLLEGWDLPGVEVLARPDVLTRMLGVLARAAREQGLNGGSRTAPSPLYLRPSTAEERRTATPAGKPSGT